MGHHNHGIPDGYKNFFVEVRQGNVPGNSMVHKFGRNDSIINNAWDLVSPTGPSGAFPASGTPVRIQAGGDAADTANGAGAREIVVIGIDTNLNEISETIVTAGADASAFTAASFWRVYRAYVTSVGTYGGTNTADIILTHTTEPIIDILAGEGQSQHGAFTVPLGKTGYLVSIALMADGNKAADFRVFIRENFNDVTAPMKPARVQLYFDGILGQEKVSPPSPILVLPALTDIWVEARGGGANTEASVDFEILLVDDDPGHLL